MKPHNDLPTFEVKLPSNGKKLSMRPFTVREEKLLLMAVESGDVKDIIETTLQVVRNCIQEGTADLDKLPFFDVDYLFIALRAKSIGEKVAVEYTCSNCDAKYKSEIDIQNCKVDKNPAIKKNIDLGNMVFTMKYPTYATMKVLNENNHDVDKKIEIIYGATEYVTQKETVYKVDVDMSKKETIELIEGLTQSQFKKLEEFVDNFPSFMVENKSKCPKCKTEHIVQYKDFSRFFV